MKIRWTRTALKHLRDTPYVIGEGVLESLELAAEFPMMHPERRRGRFRGQRWFPVGPWLTFYRIVGRDLVVTGIWHGARHDA